MGEIVQVFTLGELVLVRDEGKRRVLENLGFLGDPHEIITAGDRPKRLKARSFAPCNRTSIA